MVRRFARFATLFLASAWIPGPVQAEEPAAPANATAGDELYQLTVSPRAAPIPGFRYRLIPMESERTPGDAAPIYLRLPHEIPAERLKALAEKPFEWLRLPLEKFPVAEARAFVDGWKFRLQQIEYGSRRRTCDWNYTLPEEKEHAYEILLPDAQHLRVWGRLLALKARVEMAEGKLDESIRTIETGLAFSRHVGEGPFLINSMIAIALSRTMLDRVDELVGRPDAPNLYWALTALPSPLIGISRPFDNEVKIMDWIFPELGEIDRPTTPDEWSSLLRRFHERMSAVLKRSDYFGEETKKSLRFEADPEKFRSTHLPEARAFLESRGRPIAGLSDDQAIMLFFAGRVREISDERSKPFYLPYFQAGPLYSAVARRFEEDKAGPLGLFIALAPTVESSHAAETRLGRKVAALRVVEAIRMQAAADRGRLPESLDQVTVVPIPLDPSNGKPFELRRDGDASVLRSGPIFKGHLSYRLVPAK